MRLALATGRPLLLCADNLVAHPSLLRTLATEPAGRSTALVVADPHGDLREERGRLRRGAGGVRFAGAVWIAAADLPGLAAALHRTAGVDELLPGLLQAGLMPIATRSRLLHAERVTMDAELVARPGRAGRGGRGRGAAAAGGQGEGRLLHDVRGEQLVTPSSPNGVPGSG